MVTKVVFFSNRTVFFQRKCVYEFTVFMAKREILSHFAYFKMKQKKIGYCIPNLIHAELLESRNNSGNLQDCSMKSPDVLNINKRNNNEIIEDQQLSSEVQLKLLSNRNVESINCKYGQRINKSSSKLRRLGSPNLSARNLFKSLDDVNILSTGIAKNFSTTCNDNNKSSVADVSSKKIYKAPKSVLHNAFDIVAQQLENRDYRLQPSYTFVKGRKKSHSWCCTYLIKWPEALKFVAVGQTKQEASHKAAISALDWLQNHEKITKDGHPVFVQKNELKEILKRTESTLNLSSEICNHLNTIVELYKNKFLPELEKDLALHKGVINEATQNSNLDFNGNFKKKVFQQSQYFAKEEITLPVSEYKEQFITLLKKNQVVIIKGEPGCGKSTRIPQYVLECWAKEGLKNGDYCQIVVTQPRRIAAISLADRIAHERHEQCGHIAGYQIRLQSNYNITTGRILFCTTGVLLKYLQSDIYLSSFSHIILDEIHERDVNTDLLLNLVKSALNHNPRLKLIVMSATIDVSLFRNYLNNPPLLRIPGFTYPVKSYFLDDLKELDLSKSAVASTKIDALGVVHEDVVKVLTYIHKTREEGAILCFLPGWEDITRVEKLIPKHNDIAILCLHSRLQDSEQRKIFAKMPHGTRKIILSTNIAETSVTINDVVYVVDTGIHKEHRFDNEKGVTCNDNYWISQSSMAQRKGRAGRVQAGESFHLYTKTKYESMPKYTDPGILKTSLTKIVLNSKVYTNNMDSLKFMSQLPTPPDTNATNRAVHELTELKLLDENENLTSLGTTLANFQLEPKLAKILVNSVVFKCVTPVVDIVTIFSADSEIFSSSLVAKDIIRKIKSEADKGSDHLAVMRLFEAWLELMEDCDEESAQRYCHEANLIHHKMITINKLRKIHFDYLHNGLHDSLPISDKYSDNDELVKAILFSGAGSLLTHHNWDVVKGRYKKSNVFLTNSNQKATITSDSVNFKKTKFPYKYLIYFNEIRSNIRRTTVIRECSVISPLAIVLFSDKDLTLHQVESESNKFILHLRGTKVQLICSKEDATQIINCREAVHNMYQHFIFQMTEAGEHNPGINQIWDQVLKQLDALMLKYSTE